MKEHIKKIINHPLISGTLVIFLGSLFCNICNFLFNLFMSRNLSVSDYGILASLMSLLTLATLPAGSIIPTIINFAASYFAKGELNLVRGLFFKVTKLSFLAGFCIFLVFFLFVESISQFFNISSESLIILLGFVIFLSYAGVINGALLQAKLAFGFISFNSLLGTILKLLLGVILVFLGFAVSGAMWAIFWTGLISYALSFIPLRFLFKKGAAVSKIEIGKLFAYGAPAAISLFGLTSFVTTDILLVKHFFPPAQAGIYAGLSLVGRVIFFFSAPISTVMFPLIVQKHAKEENYKNIFKIALFLVFLSSMALTIFYFLFPEFVIKFFIKREEYLIISPLLGLFSLFITAYSLLSIMTNFYLSIKKTKIYIPITLAAIFQAILIFYLHQNFLQIIIISLSITILLLVSLLLYYPHATKNKG